MKRMLVAVLAALLAVPAVAGAVETELGLEFGQFEYREPGVMSEEGLQSGVFVDKRFANGRTRTQFHFSVVGGDLAYDGGLQQRNSWTGAVTVTPATATTPNLVINARVTRDYRVELGRSVWLAPLGGGAVRLLRNDLNVPLQLEGHDGVYDNPSSGYWRDQLYFYAPAGLVVGVPVAKGWRAEGTAEYDVFLVGVNHSYNGCGMDLWFDQWNGSGYRFAVKFLSPVVYRGARVTIEPFLERWEVDDSGVVDNYKEPRNNTMFYGVRVGVAF